MLRYTQDDTGSEDLQEALDTMLSVLKYVNDIMHQVGITGYNVGDTFILQCSFSLVAHN